LEKPPFFPAAIQAVHGICNRPIKMSLRNDLLLLSQPNPQCQRFNEH
jgi:hypothetical protein